MVLSIIHTLIRHGSGRTVIPFTPISSEIPWKNGSTLAIPRHSARRLGLCPLPSSDWSTLRAYALSPRPIGPPYGNIPLPPRPIGPLACKRGAAARGGARPPASPPSSAAPPRAPRSHRSPAPPYSCQGLDRGKLPVDSKGTLPVDGKGTLPVDGKGTLPVDGLQLDVGLRGGGHVGQVPLEGQAPALRRHEPLQRCHHHPKVRLGGARAAHRGADPAPLPGDTRQVRRRHVVRARVLQDALQRACDGN
eukprot:1194431-Prorocentrum_minimum.AAC.3